MISVKNFKPFSISVFIFSSRWNDSTLLVTIVNLNKKGQERNPENNVTTNTQVNVLHRRKMNCLCNNKSVRFKSDDDFFINTSINTSKVSIWTRVRGSFQSLRPLSVFNISSLPGVQFPDRIRVRTSILHGMTKNSGFTLRVFDLSSDVFRNVRDVLLNL